MTDFHAAPASWMHKQLKWAVTFQRGHDLPDDAREEGPIPVYAGGGITGWHKEFCAPPPGIVTGRYGTIGEFHLVSTPYWPLNTALYSIDLHDNDPEYLRYLLEFLAPLFHVHAGKSAVPGVDRNDIHTIPVALPERKQQRRIAAVLGRETRRIDGLLAAKLHVLDLLAEKRKTIIATAVTRGLDPKVKLRDSGVPWLGEIPAHWETERARWLFRERDERGEPELPLMEVSIANGVTVREFSAERIETTAVDFNSYKVARRNDIAFNKMRMWQGAVGLSPVDGLVSPDYVVAEPTGRMLPDFADALLRTEALSAECGRRSHGLTWDRLRIYWGEFREIELPLPSREEQRAIVEHIAREAAKIDAVRAATEHTIALLKERRSALIAAAVTGQLDVGAAA